MQRSHGVGYYVQMTINAPKLKQFGVEGMYQNQFLITTIIQCKFDSQCTRNFYLSFLY
jgi:hypothetical protein